MAQGIRLEYRTSSPPTPIMSRLSLPILTTAWWPALLCVAGCIGPSDVSDEVFVTVEAPSHVVIQGRAVTLRAHTWRRVSADQVEEVQAVSYHWEPRSEGLVSLADSGDRVTVTGVARGEERIVATPVDFEDAEPGSWDVRVAASVEIDQVVPASVRYGEEVTVSGVGLGHAARFTLGEADLIPEAGSFSGDSAGLGELRLWVPSPARSDRLLAVTPEGTSTAADDSTTVAEFDPFEPNDDDPAMLHLEQGSEAATLFFNPALALESGGIDRYRLLPTDPGQPLTLLLATSFPLPAAFDVDVSVAGRPWRIGVRDQLCRDGVVRVEGIAPDTVVRAFTSVPPEGLELVVRGPPSRYDMRILSEYRQQNPAIAPDRFEDNDDCVAADDPAKVIDLSSPFSEALTIDNGYELDWYRFTVPGPGSQLVTIRTAAHPLTAVDSSDVALFLLTAPQPGSDPVAQSDQPGSSEVLSLELEPGDYYLLVADRGGVAVRYGLCLGLGSSCPLPDSS
jgi:hypothetical protein